MLYIGMNNGDLITLGSFGAKKLNSVDDVWLLGVNAVIKRQNPDTQIIELDKVAIRARDISWTTVNLKDF